MRLWKKNGDRVLLVGVFQNLVTGRAVTKNLYRTGFRRVAAIHASAGGQSRVEKYGISTIAGAAAISAFSLATGAFMFWQRGILADYRPGVLALLLTAFALAGALSAWILVWLLQQHLDEKKVARFAGLILPVETVVLAEVKASETARRLGIFGVRDAEVLVIFVFFAVARFYIYFITTLY